MIRASLVLSLLVLASPAPAWSQDSVTPINVIPRPVSVTRRTGWFTITPTTVIRTDGPSAVLGRQLAGMLAPATGFELPVRSGGVATGARIEIAIDTTLGTLGPEGYRLDATPARVRIVAPAAAGLFYGFQTLRQLLPADIYRSARVDGAVWTVPAVLIEDYPRFRWRGAHLDVSRHFMPREFVKKYIDLLAIHKMNSFHWHLTDDQGWRLQIRKYPLLTSVGGWRKQTMIGKYVDDTTKWQFDGERHGGFYTQADVREIVEYARERFVNVVPEIEMPGHSVAAIAAYPALGVTGEANDVATWWGVFDNILTPEDSTVQFMQNVLTEVMELFPSKYIHIGGDEAAKARWKASPRVQARIKAVGLKNEEEMQSWLVRQMDAFLTAHGRRLIGWDEILEGGLASGATVMSWRGEDGGIAAARAGHDVVMAPSQFTYLDHYQSLDKASEPLAIGGYLPLDTVYAYDPVPKALEAKYAAHVLGAQAQVWTEYIRTPKEVEYMAFPRLSALSEAVWTPLDRKNFVDFLGRLGVHLSRLDVLDVNYHPLAH